MEKEELNKDMLIGDVINLYPETMEVFQNYGFHCIGCSGSAWESIEDGAAVHGIYDEDFDKFMNELKEVIEKSKKNEHEKSKIEADSE